MQKKLSGKARIASFSPFAPFTKIGELTIPWIFFLALLLWAWRVSDPFHGIPFYGDVLEVAWGVAWLGDHLVDGQLLFFPLIFHPEGWQVAVSGYGLGMSIQLLPLYWLGGAAFAYNAVTIISFFIAFAGMYLLMRRMRQSFFAATLAALLFTFWGFRWGRIGGHLNILVGTALFPWMVWCLERSFHSPRRFRLWLGLTGVSWAIASANSFYFLFIGGFVLVGWVAGRFLTRQISWRTAIGSVLVPTCITVLLNMPALLLFVKGKEVTEYPFLDIFWMNEHGASLNSIPIPRLGGPWLRSLAEWIYHGPWHEGSFANFGIVAFFFALLSLRRIWWDKEMLPFLFLTGIGLVLALGITLKWDGRAIQVSVLQSFNSAIWRIAHFLKPGFFTATGPPPPFDQAILMPTLALVALVPFAEGVRVLSRYGFVAAVGFFPMVSKEVGRITFPLARVIVGALLIIEIFPDPSGSVPFPPVSHPAFEWLRQSTLPKEGIADLYATGSVLRLRIGGEVLSAIQYHQRATISATGAMWPAHTWFLYNWLSAHPHPFRDSDFIPMLRSYKVNYILLHMQSEDDKVMLQRGQENAEVRTVQCFDPPTGPSPWSYPICILKILPSAQQDINVLLREGWSAFEEWGVWAEGTESRIQWVATLQADYHLRVTAFPECVPDKPQGIALEIQGIQLMKHEWQDCGPWSADVLIPASLTRVGWNDLELRYAYAAEPAVLTGGTNSDMRMLSLGFTKLTVER